ncbi:hypothetical protein [Lysobacter sp. CA199]|uniref:hypothetical protein n=1 Tax=Lysobacter sp. CA199 TaxID=3455608 RepID=UPI003F8D0A7F
MMVQMTCPCCFAEFPVEAGLVEADGKRLAAALGVMDADLVRVLFGYLRLHKPAQRALAQHKALTLAVEIGDLVASGEVRRNGVSRPASLAVWAQAIEQMLEGRSSLRLPLKGHGYLLEVVFGLADRADAENEREREQRVREGRRPDAVAQPKPKTSDAQARREALENELYDIAHRLRFEQISEQDAQRLRAEAPKKHGF